MSSKTHHKHGNWESSNQKQLESHQSNAFIRVGEILTIISAIVWCITIIGMIWGVPMIIGCRQRLENKKKITIMHIVIAIIFYWFIGGVLTLIGAVQEKII